MARLNIYLPDELKLQMEKLHEQPNWSDVVRPSIQAAIAQVKHKETHNMNTSIERLKASKAQFCKEERSEGYTHGQEWARDIADYRELKVIASLGDVHRLQATDALKRALDPNNEDEDSFENLVGDREPSEEYCAAFIQGAQEFFGKVEDQL